MDRWAKALAVQVSRISSTKPTINNKNNNNKKRPRYGWVYIEPLSTGGQGRVDSGSSLISQPRGLSELQLHREALSQGNKVASGLHAEVRLQPQPAANTHPEFCLSVQWYIIIEEWVWWFL